MSTCLASQGETRFESMTQNNSQYKEQDNDHHNPDLKKNFQQSMDTKSIHTGLKTIRSHNFKQEIISKQLRKTNLKSKPAHITLFEETSQGPKDDTDSLCLGKRGSFDLIDEESDSDEFEQYVPEKFKHIQNVSLQTQRAKQANPLDIPTLEDMVLQSGEQEDKEDIFGSFEDFDAFGDLDEDCELKNKSAIEKTNTGCNKTSVKSQYSNTNENIASELEDDFAVDIFAEENDPFDIPSF